MDERTAALSITIGRRVGDLRRSRRWTLDQLAQASGLSRRMVINVEQGTVNPSVGTLLRLSEALGITLHSLVERSPDTAVQVTRVGDGPVLWAGASGGQGVIVASSGGSEAFELWAWTLQPGEHRSSEAHTAGTRELTHVRTGVLELTVGDQVEQLATGDSAAFPGDLPHRYANNGSEVCEFTLAVLESDPNPAHRQELS